MGDTEAGSTHCPGHQEAEAVASALGGGNYSVMALYQPRQNRMRHQRMFARDYKIIHLAARHLRCG
jgi:hypothetical protein